MTMKDDYSEKIAGYSKEYDEFIKTIPESVRAELTFEYYCSARANTNLETCINELTAIFCEFPEAVDNSLDYKISARSMLFPSSFTNLTTPTLPCKCGICNQNILHPKDFSWDHIIPLATVFNAAAPGEYENYEDRVKMYNNIRNLQFAHRACNSRKNSAGVKYNTYKILVCLNSYKK